MNPNTPGYVSQPGYTQQVSEQRPNQHEPSEQLNFTMQSCHRATSRLQTEAQGTQNATPPWQPQTQASASSIKYSIDPQYVPLELFDPDAMADPLDLDIESEFMLPEIPQELFEDLTHDSPLELAPPFSEEKELPLDLDLHFPED